MQRNRIANRIKLADKYPNNFEDYVKKYLVDGSTPEAQLRNAMLFEIALKNNDIYEETKQLYEEAFINNQFTDGLKEEFNDIFINTYNKYAKDDETVHLFADKLIENLNNCVDEHEAIYENEEDSEDEEEITDEENEKNDNSKYDDFKGEFWYKENYDDDEEDDEEDDSEDEEDIEDEENEENTNDEEEQQEDNKEEKNTDDKKDKEKSKDDDDTNNKKKKKKKKEEEDNKKKIKINGIDDKAAEKKYLSIIAKYDSSFAKQKALAEVVSAFAQYINDYTNGENFLNFVVDKHYSIDNIYTIFFLYSDNIKISNDGTPYKEIFDALKNDVELVKNGSFVKMLLADLQKGIDLQYILKYCKHDLNDETRKFYHDALNNENIMQYADKVFGSNLDEAHFKAVINYITTNKENDINNAINSICNPLYPLDSNGNIDTKNSKGQQMHSSQSFEKKLDDTLDSYIPKNKNGNPVTRGNGTFFTKENISKFSGEELDYLSNNYSKIKKEVMEIVFDDKYNFNLQEIQNLVELSNLGFTKEQLEKYASQNFSQEQIEVLEKIKQEKKITAQAFNLLLDSNLSTEIIEELYLCLTGENDIKPLSFNQVESLKDYDFDTIHYVRLNSANRKSDDEEDSEQSLNDEGIKSLLKSNNISLSGNDLKEAIECCKVISEDTGVLNNILKSPIIKKGQNKLDRLLDIADFVYNGGSVSALDNVKNDTDFILLFGNVIGYNEIDEIYEDFNVNREGSLVLFKILIQNGLDTNSNLYKYEQQFDTDLDGEQLNIVNEMFSKYGLNYNSDVDLSIIDACINFPNNYKDLINGNLPMETFLYCVRKIQDDSFTKKSLAMADSVEDFCYSLESDLQNNTISQEELDDMYSNNQVLQQYKDKEENNKDEENTEEENNEEEESFDADADEDTNENKKEKKPNAIIEKIKKWFNGLNSDSKKTLNYFKKEYPDNFKNFIQDESNKTWFDNGLEQLSPQDYEGFVDLIATTKNIGRVKQLFNDGQEYKDVVLEELTDIVENSTNYTKENINPLQLLTEIENSDISSVFGSSDSMEILKDIYDKNSRYKNMLSGFKDDVETIVKCMKCFYKISNCLSKFDASDPDIANESQYQKDVLKQIENGNYNDDIYRKTFASQKSKRLIQAKFKRLVHK